MNMARSAAIRMAVLLLAVALARLALEMPAAVPDTSSPPAHNAVGTANNWHAVGQTFVPERNGLHRISLVLGAEELTGSAQIAFHIKETPTGEPLRTVKRTISRLPHGHPSRFRPGSLEERWHDFEFEPIPDSAGRKLYFSVEGRDVPRENTVMVLLFHHSGYPQGEAYANEKPMNAHVVFRAYSRGSVADLLGVIGDNLTRNRPGLLSSPATYLALALVYVLLVGVLIGMVRRTAAPSPSGDPAATPARMGTGTREGRGYSSS